MLAHPDGYRILHGSQAALIATIRSGLGQPQDIARLLRWSEPLRKPPERMLAGADMTLGESLDRHGISGPDPRGGAAPVLPAGLRRRGPAARPTSSPCSACRRCGWACPPCRRWACRRCPTSSRSASSIPSSTASTCSGCHAQHRRGRPHPHRRRQDHGPGGRGGHRPDDGLVTARPRHPGDARAVDLVVRHRGPADHDEDAVREPDGPGDRARSRTRWSSPTSRRATRPPGQHLVAACSVPVPSKEVGTETEAEVRTQLGADLPHRHQRAGAWSTATSHSAAWPAARPPLIIGREVDLGDGLFVAGDHRETAEHPGRHALRSARGRRGARGAGRARQALSSARAGRAPSRPPGTASSRSCGHQPDAGYAGPAGPRRWPRPRG